MIQNKNSVKIRFGKNRILKIPKKNLLSVLTPRKIKGVENQKMEILKALNNPIENEKLRSIVSKNSKVSIIVSDITRPTPNHIIVPVIVENLDELGLDRENISVVFGTGIHRNHTRKEKEKLTGNTKDINIFDHSSKDKDNLMEIGTTRDGTEILVNRKVYESDVVITTGCVEFHYVAGYTGGKKSILPGISGEPTIIKNHSKMITKEKECESGKLDGNPVHEEMVEASRLLRVDYNLNVVLNEKKEIVKAFGGNIHDSHLKCVELCDLMYKIKIPRKADIVVVNTKYPKNINLYQAQKALENAVKAVKQNGAIIWNTECFGGFGNETFYRWMIEAKTPSEIIEKMKSKGFLFGAHKAYMIARALEKADVILVSKIPNHLISKTFISLSTSLEKALEISIKRAGKDPEIIVMPFGETTLPSIK
ncbi:MAG: nickel-dependent lactate racemase [Methanosarcinales archaeon]